MTKQTLNLPPAPARNPAPAYDAPPASGAMRPLRYENPGMDYWRVERVARYLDVTRKRVYQLIEEKKLVALRLSPRNMRVLRSSIEQYLEVLLTREDA